MSDNVAAEQLREVWLPVLDYDGLYEASNAGRIRNARSGLILQPTISPCGYPTVTLCRDGAKAYVRVHRAVLMAFCGRPPFADAHACHNDGNRLNARLSNLRWGSPAENAADTLRHGRTRRGTRINGAKLNPTKVRAIRRRIAAGELHREIAASFDIDATTVSNIRRKRSWAHVE